MIGEYIARTLAVWCILILHVGILTNSPESSLRRLRLRIPGGV